MTKTVEQMNILLEEFSEIRSLLAIGPSKEIKESNHCVKEKVQEIQRLSLKIVEIQESLLLKKSKEMETVELQINKSNIYPKWIVNIIVITFFLIITLIAGLVFKLKEQGHTTTKYYLKGRQDAYEQLGLFFDAHAKSKEEYRVWKSKNSN